jgi:hypothetical protein
MLIGMDIAAVQAAPSTAPWLVLAAVLAVVLLGLAGLVAVLVLRRPPGDGPARRPDEPAPDATDDLPGFLEHPPGSPGSPSPAAAGWPALSASPSAEPPRAPLTEPPAPERGRRQTGLALAALSVTALLLVGVGAALAVAAQRARTDPEVTAALASDADPAPSPTAPSQAAEAGALATSSVAPGRTGTKARLTFGGIVLERRAVGVTATYPRIELTSDGDHAVAHVELPTFNCLTDHAPADPVAAGCLRSLTEHGDLATPELEVSRHGDRVRVSGRFPTYLRPNGTPPVWTGRVYGLTVSAEPGAGDPDEGPVPATGALELGPDRTETTGDDGSEIGFGP